MFFRDHLKWLLTGLTIPQEYICIGLNAFQFPMSVFAEAEDLKFLLDVTTSHLFLGYRPLIIGLPFSMDDKNFETMKDQCQKSKSFNFRLPKNVIRYGELKRIDSFDYNIHRIHLYEVIHMQVIEEGKSTLAHIHQYYAQWRFDHGIQTQIFLR